MFRLIEKNIHLLFLLCVSLILFNCSGPGVSGATSETTNGQVSSVAIDENGYTIANASVYVYKKDALRSINDSDLVSYTKTKDDGSFIINDLDSADYNIEIVDSMGKRAQVSVTYDSIDGSHDIHGVEQITLKSSGRLYGIVVHNPDERIYVQVYGLHRIVQVDTSGYFVFSDLPKGDVTIRIVTDTGFIVEEKDSFDIKSSESTNCGNYSTLSSHDIEYGIIRDFLDVNGLQNIEVDSVAHGSPKHYYYIYCDNLGIDSLTSDLFELRLKHLSLARNDIDYLPEKIGKLATLEYLDISHNDISYLPESMGFLESLYELDMGSNNLTDLPESILNLEYINDLYVNDNRLHDLQPHIRNWVDKYSKDPNWEHFQR